MATKYDYFEIFYKNKSILNAKDIARQFPKEKYSTIYKQLLELQKENFIEKKNTGFQIVNSKKTNLLFTIIEHCLKNQINYNLVLDKNFASFVKFSLERKEINSKNLKLNPRTLKKYILILKDNELALIISKRPLRAKVFYNPLLNNILLFFGFTNLNLNKEKKDYKKEIEKEIKVFNKLRRQNEWKYKKIIEEMQIHFVYHSLSIEGNPATLLDTEKILKNKILPSDLISFYAEEIKNYRDAIRKMLIDAEEDKLLSIPLILEYHEIAMKHKIEIAGKIRLVPVHISNNLNFKISKPKDILPDLNSLLLEYSKFVQKSANFKNILDFAVQFHNTFQHIHPFKDGNSRTTRLLTFYIFQQKGIPIIDIPYGLLNEYITRTKGSKIRDDEKLKGILQETILFNLEKIKGLLK